MQDTTTTVASTLAAPLPVWNGVLDDMFPTEEEPYRCSEACGCTASFPMPYATPNEPADFFDIAESLFESVDAFGPYLQGGILIVDENVEAVEPTALAETLLDAAIFDVVECRCGEPVERRNDFVVGCFHCEECHNINDGCL